MIFPLPIHFPVTGQWWSKLYMQTLQSSQWVILGPFITLHFLQYYPFSFPISQSGGGKFLLAIPGFNKAVSPNIRCDPKATNNTS